MASAYGEQGYTKEYYGSKTVEIGLETIEVSFCAYDLPCDTDLDDWIFDQNFENRIRDVINGCIDNCDLRLTPWDLPDQIVFTTFENQNRARSDILCLCYPSRANEQEKQLLIKYGRNHYLRVNLQNTMAIVFSKELNSSGFIQTMDFSSRNTNMEAIREAIRILESKL